MKNTQRLWSVIAAFFALYVLLPEYLAVELSASIPLLTASRAVLLCLALCAVCSRKLGDFCLTSDRLLRTGFLCSFALTAIANLTHITASPAYALKGLAVLAEGYLVMWCAVRLLSSREKVLGVLWALVLLSGAVGAVSAAGCAMGENPFHLLCTVDRDMLMSEYVRLGLLRASATFGHAVYYGAFCAVMLPLCVFFVMKHAGTRRWIATACAAMNLTGLVLSNSRGSLLAAAFVAMIIVLTHLRQIKTILLRGIPVVVIALAVLVLATSISGVGPEFVSDVTLSVVGVGADPEALELSQDYGENIGGIASRTAQLTGMVWAAQRSPVTGLGYSAHTRGLVSYQWEKGVWQATATFDMAPVAVFCQYGVLGLLGWVLLYLLAFITMLRRCKEPLMRCLTFMALTMGICMLAVSDMDALQWLLLGVLASLVNLEKKEALRHGL